VGLFPPHSILPHLGGRFSSSRSGHRRGGLLQPPHCSPPPVACGEGGQGAPRGAKPPGNECTQPLIPPIPITEVHRCRIKLATCVTPPNPPLIAHLLLHGFGGTQVLGPQSKRQKTSFFSLLAAKFASFPSKSAAGVNTSPLQTPTPGGFLKPLPPG